MNPTVAAICALLRGEAAPALWRQWGDADWARLVAVASAHGVAPLLQRALAAAGWPAAMPPAARDHLRACVYETTGRNMRSYGALGAVLRAVAPGTPVVVLKGAALGAYLYPAQALRPLSDLDLLVRPGDLDGVAAAVAGLGFAARPHMAPELARAVEPHLALFGGPAGAVLVELHWALLSGSAPWRRAPLDWFWRRTEPWRPPAACLAPGLPPPAALQLTPTASLLHQCAHLVIQHGRDQPRLIWLYDLHLLASCGAVAWDDLVAEARRLRWGAVARLALGQAARCFGTALEPALLDDLRGPLDRRVRFRGLDAPGAPQPSSVTWAALAELSLPTRLRFLARVALPSRAWLRASYEPRWGPWWPLAYPYRWLKPVGRLVAPRRPAEPHDEARG